MNKAILCSLNPASAGALEGVLARMYETVTCTPEGVNEALSKANGCSLFVFDAAVDVFAGGVENVEGDLAKHNAVFSDAIRAVSAAARSMKAAGIEGSIVIITSARAQLARPGDGLYGSLYTALHRAAESFAIDLAPEKIRVNCVCVGLTDTQPREERETEWLMNKIPMRRIGTMEDVGSACMFLGSDKASYITGINIRIDGGLMLPTMPDNKPDCSSDDFVGFDYVKMKKPVRYHD